MYFYTLGNGMKVNFDPVQHTEIVTVNIMVKVGVCNENKNNNGISHMTEHLLFKTKYADNYKLITEYIDYIGGYINAFTGKEYTCFVIQTTNKYVFEVIKKLIFMVFNANFDKGEFLVEKEVVLQELSQHNDKLMWKSKYNGIRKMLGSNNPLSYNILGTKENILKMNYYDVVDYYNLYYNTFNTAISISGGINDETIIKIKEILAKIPMRKKGELININNNMIDECAFGNGKTIEKIPNLRQSYICVSYPAISRKEYPKYLKLLLLNSILGSNRNSRLVQNTREKKGLAYTISSIPTAYQNLGILNIYSVVAKGNEEIMLEEIFNTINEICSHGITNHELEAGKSKINTEILFSLERTIDRARFWNEVQLFDNHFINITNIKEILNEMDKEDIKKITNEIFSSKPVVSIVGG